MDEASQTSPLVGLIAMSCAKHFVVVGDLMQISAICTVNNSVKKYKDDKDFTKNVPDCQCPAECKEYDLYDFEDPQYGMSILKSTQLIFKNESNSAFLQEHYRCHPGIIGFCNDEIYSKYEKPLLVETKNYNKDIETPIRVRYFEGGYSEKHKNEAGSFKSRHNLKQIEVFMTDEWPKLHERLESAKEKGEELSCCVISPFKGQLEQLKWEIEKNNEDLQGEIELQEMNDAERDAEEVDIPMLSVHKSQGREFDIVYFMPVDDNRWDWPWSQSRELVNVAVSRAKKELIVITSTCLMEKELQEEFAEKYAKPYFDKGLTRKEREEAYKKNLFIMKLCSWVRERFPRENPTKGDFGFFPASNKSVFDLAYFYRNSGYKNVYESFSYQLDSAYEAALFDCLVGTHLSFCKQVRINEDTTIRYDDHPNEDHEWSFDFVIYDKETLRILLIIEVDGQQHRTRKKVEERDAQKDGWAIDNNGVVLYGNKLAEGEELSDKLPPEASFALLRLSTDGATAYEVEEISEFSKKSNYFTVQDAVNLILKNTDKKHFKYLTKECVNSSRDKLDRIIDHPPCFPLSYFLKNVSTGTEEGRKYIGCLKEKLERECLIYSAYSSYSITNSGPKNWEATTVGQEKGIVEKYFKKDGVEKWEVYFPKTEEMEKIIYEVVNMPKE